MNPKWSSSLPGGPSSSAGASPNGLSNCIPPVEWLILVHNEYTTRWLKTADYRSTQTSNPRDWVCLYRDASCHVLQSLLPDMKYG
jgi:hypothetical protein